MERLISNTKNFIFKNINFVYQLLFKLFKSLKFDVYSNFSKPLKLSKRIIINFVLYIKTSYEDKEININNFQLQMIEKKI